MYKPHRKPRPKSKTSHISKHSPSPLHHTFLLGRARFTALPLSALDLPDQSQLSVKNIQQGICIFLQNTVTNVTSLKTSKLLITKVQKKLDVE